MGVTKLDGKSLPGYPYGIDRQHDKWPADPRTNNKYLQFWWSAKLDDTVNVAGLKNVFDSVRATGAARVPTAARFGPRPRCRLEEEDQR